jgi:hypothetical protein
MFQLPLLLDNGITVLEKYSFEHKFAQPGTGVTSEVTKCRYQGKVFYVRENYNGVPSFYQHSNHRMAIKTMHIDPHLQTLELCCPDDLFTELATTIHEFDHLKRPVRKNSKFTYKWALRKDDKTRLY